MRLRPGATPEPAVIEEVDEASPILGKVAPGDRLITINGIRPRDLIEFMLEQDSDRIDLRVETDEGVRDLCISPEPGRGLGLTFSDLVFDGIRACRNACVFCFVDRMPPGLRPSLYIKDDDWRLSVLSGNFVTLNNLGKEDVRRILELRPQPLYVSLHASDPALRDRMMGGKCSADALRLLKKLIDLDIEAHLQIVLCPGLNDGERLDETLRDILEYLPAASAGIVPVGLSGTGRGEPLRAVGAGEAARVLEAVERFQAEALRRHGRRLFYAADEFYILAGAPFPQAGEYEDFPQLENGIGLARDLIDAAREALAGRAECEAPERTAVLTGELGPVVLEQALLGTKGKLLESVVLVPVENRLFGPGVTVAGLVSGADVKWAVKRLGGYGKILVPAVMLREGLFLDSVSVEEVREDAPASLRVVENTGAALVEAIFAAEEGS